MRADLRALDQEIRVLQSNYAHTYLVPPIGGIVTSVYKDIGESVEPGEPILRVENDAYVLLVGIIQVRSAIWPGVKITLTAKDIFETGSTKKVTATIVSVRGHDADNDEWEIVAEAKNPYVTGKPTLPLNYHFDTDTTDIKVDV